MVDGEGRAEAINLGHGLDLAEKLGGFTVGRLDQQGGLQVDTNWAPFGTSLGPRIGKKEAETISECGLELGSQWADGGLREVLI
ncbi:unnamed protein product [Linum trigynum]|uniref:Uncharacterized protein n=1 Tax=Linum trigynum TaxID=586398 RepID=A0AAV2E9F4_9ROSI